MFFLAAIVDLDLERWRVYVGLIKQALRMSGHSDKQAAIVMDMSKSQLSRQLAGVEKLAHPDTMRLSPEYHSWHGLLTIQHYGMPTEVQSAMPVASWLESGRFNLSVNQGGN